MNCPHCSRKISDAAVLSAAGGIAASRRTRSGPLRSGDRCPCGEMTAKRAAARGHKCEAKNQERKTR